MGHPKDNMAVNETNAFNKLVEAVGRLCPSLPEDEYRREIENITAMAEMLKHNAEYTRQVAECAVRLVGTSMPIEAMQCALVDTIKLVHACRGVLYFWEEGGTYFDRLHSIEGNGSFNHKDQAIADEIALVSHENDVTMLNPEFGKFPKIQKLIGEDEFAVRSIIASPISISIDGIVDKIGVLYIDVPAAAKTFDENDLWVVRLFTSLAALSIRNIRMTASLRLAYRETVYALVKALEAKDPYTKGHSDRVAEYSERCGKKFELGMERLQVLYSAALLHDVGKIGIRENVLNKPSKLTSEEYTHIKKHPEISEAILHGLDFLREENEFLKQHHERYDGKGYPKGLKGDDISIEGAIIQVADAWDAMTSRRIYREELDLENALCELRNNSGTQFNPLVVEKFILIIEEDGVVPVNAIANDN